MAQFVLIHSPLIGPSSLAPTAAVLRAQGSVALVPTPDPALGPCPWHEWPHRLADTLPQMKDVILVGHSAGGLLAAHLAGTLQAKALICLDAMMPPEAGPIPPVEADFMAFVRSLPTKNGLLPVWTDWWASDILAGVQMGAEVKAAFLAEQPHLSLSWFDDAFDMPDWSTCKRGYIQTSPVFDDEATRAEERGWPVVRIQGTHLHPTSAPQETANALLEISRILALI